MKAFVFCLAIAIVGVSAAPEYYGNYQQQQQWQYDQWLQQQQQQQQQPQYNQNQQLSPDGYRIVPGVVDPRCPRTDDAKNPTHLPIQGKCNKFMKCYGGRAYEQECPAGLEFGISVNRCDYPTIARCSNSGW